MCIRDSDMALYVLNGFYPDRDCLHLSYTLSPERQVFTGLTWMGTLQIALAQPAKRLENQFS